MIKSADGDALVVVSVVGLLSVIAIADEFAKTLGMTDVKITAERGGGRLVARWWCADDIALEVRRTLSRLPSDICGTCRLFVTLNSSALPDAALDDRPSKGDSSP